MFEKIKNKKGIGICNNNIAVVHLRNGRFTEGIIKIIKYFSSHILFQERCI